MYKSFKSHSHWIQQRWSGQERPRLRKLLNHVISQWLGQKWLRNACHQPAESLGGSLLTAFSIWEVAVLVGMDCNKHVAVPHPQLMEMSQSYPSFVPWTTLSHGLLNRIPKMLIEQACLHYGLWKSELTRRKPSMNPNRRSLKESFNSTG